MPNLVGGHNTSLVPTITPLQSSNLSRNCHTRLWLSNDKSCSSATGHLPQLTAQPAELQKSSPELCTNWYEVTFVFLGFSGAAQICTLRTHKNPFRNYYMFAIPTYHIVSVYVGIPRYPRRRCDHMVGAQRIKTCKIFAILFFCTTYKGASL